MSKLMEKNHYGTQAHNADLREYKEDIKGDIKSLKNNVSGLAENLKEEGALRAHEAADYMRDRWHDLQDTGKRQLENVEARVREKPGQSVAIAFVAGILASLILGRR